MKRQLARSGEGQFDSSGNLVGMVRTPAGHPMVNISIVLNEILQLQKQLNDLTNKYQQTAKAYVSAVKENEALKGIVATVSHELRTPLNIASGFNNFLLNEKAGPLLPDQQIFLDSVRVSLTQAQMLVEDLLVSNQINGAQLRLNLEPVELNALIRETLDLFWVVADAAGVSLLFEACDVACEVLAAPDRLKQSLYNLISNAIKFSPTGETVKISVRQTDSACLIIVKDNGPGISAENLDRIFHRYFQITDSSNRHLAGRGLGLSIARELIELQQGQMWAESTVGKGSRFFISLPRLAQP